MDESFGVRLRRMRLAVGMSQPQLGGTSLSGSYISLLEADKRQPTVRVLEQLAQALGCSVAALRDGLDEQTQAAADLEASWAELALADGDAQGARQRAARLLDQDLGGEAQWRVRLTHALACERLGDLEDAIRDLEILQRLAVSAPKRWPILPVTIALCRCYREAGDATHSIEVARDALLIADELGLRGTDEHAELRSSLAAGYYHRGDLMKAGQLIADLLIDLQDAGSPRARAAALWNASVVAHERGSTGEALRLADQALILLTGGAEGRNRARLQLLCAALLLRLEQPDALRARDLLTSLVDELAAVGSVVDLAYARTELARADLTLGNPAAAAAHAQAALELLGPEPRLEKAQSVLMLARALRAQEKMDEAIARSRQAAQLIGASSSGRDAALAWNELAELLVELGQPDEALRAYRQAMAAVGLQQLRSDHLSRVG